MSLSRTQPPRKPASFPKRCAGWLLIQCASWFPSARPWLRRWGLRTHPEWFGERVVRVRVPGKKPLLLSGISTHYQTFQLFWNGPGFWDPLTLALLRLVTRPGDTLLDVAARAGCFAFLSRLQNPGLRVIAFESSPPQMSLLRRNARTNKVEDLNVESLVLTSPVDAAVLLSREEKTGSRICEMVKVPAVTLDSYLARSFLPGRIFIRVGAEADEGFFEGARQTLEHRHPELFLDGTGHACTPENARHLRSLGYRFHSISPNGAGGEAAEARPVIRDGLIFPYFWITTRPLQQAAFLLDQLKALAGDIDFRHTTNRLDEFYSRQPRRFTGGNTALPAEWI